MASAHFMVDGYGNIYAPLLPLLIPKLHLTLAAAGTLTMLYQIAASVAQVGFRTLTRTFGVLRAQCVGGSSGCEEVPDKPRNDRLPRQGDGACSAARPAPRRSRERRVDPAGRCPRRSAHRLRAEPSASSTSTASGMRPPRSPRLSGSSPRSSRSSSRELSRGTLHGSGGRCLWSCSSCRSTSSLRVHERLERITGIDWQVLYSPLALVALALWLVVGRRLRESRSGVLAVCSGDVLRRRVAGDRGRRVRLQRPPGRGVQRARRGRGAARDGGRAPDRARARDGVARRQPREAGVGCALSLRFLRQILRRTRPEPEPGEVPGSVAIILDGNGRWAEERGLPVEAGHREGTRALRRTVEAAIDLGIESLTVYAFSTENWLRPPPEVDSLMEIFEETIDRELPDLAEQGVRTRFIGRRDRAPEKLRARMAELERETADRDRLQLWIAFDYGGRAELAEAARRMIEAGLARRGGRRGRARRLPLRSRYARPGPRDPDVRRVADLQLPALAARLLRARLRRHALARLRRGRPEERRGRVRGPATEVRRPMSSHLVADPHLGRRHPDRALARLPRAAGGCSRSLRAAALVGLHELYWMTRTLRPVVLAGYLGALAALARRDSRRPGVGACRLHEHASRSHSSSRASRGRGRRRPCRSRVTMLGVGWIGLGLAHALLLRDIPEHGVLAAFAVLLAVWAGDSARIPGRRPLRSAQAGADGLSRQDLGGPHRRHGGDDRTPPFSRSTRRSRTSCRSPRCWRSAS